MSSLLGSFKVSIMSMICLIDDLILPDEEVLNAQVCQKCFNYLSVGPVQSCEGKAICGRCYLHAEIKGFKFKSLYNLVAEELAFRCLNYSTGCRKHFRFNASLEHEKSCRALYVCPFCSYIGNGCQLIYHCNNDHPEYVVKEDSFKFFIQDKGERNLIFLKHDRIIHLKMVVKGKYVEIYSIICAPCPKMDAPLYDFKLKFFDSVTYLETSPISAKFEVSKFVYQKPYVIHQDIITDCFPRGLCSCKFEFIDHDNAVEKESYFTKIVEQIPLKFLSTTLETERDAISVLKEDYFIDRFFNKSSKDLKKIISSGLCALQICTRCKRHITTGIYFCPKYHISCEACRKKQCVRCSIVSGNKTKLHNITLQCDWEGCSTLTGIFEYLKHKRDCEFRRFECPDETCTFVGCVGCLRKHWHLNPLVCNDKICPLGNYALYWLDLQNNELFFVRTSSNKFHTLISIDEVDVVMRQIYKCSLFTSQRKLPLLPMQNVPIDFELFSAVKPTHFVRYLEVVNCSLYYLCME